MMSHPFLSFRDHINSLFDDFHNDCFADPFAKDTYNNNNNYEQRRHRGGHDRRRLNYDNEPSSRQDIQPYNNAGWLSNWDQSMQPASTIRLNIHEEKDKYVVQADVPGVRKEDVHVNIQDGYLTISAERKEVHQEGDPSMMKAANQQQKGQANAAADQQPQRRWVRREVRYGKVERSIALPRDIDQGKISAKQEHGVLKIVLPKSEQQRSQERIAIE